jgi:hypothetical protein
MTYNRPYEAVGSSVDTWPSPGRHADGPAAGSVRYAIPQSRIA